MVGGLLGRFFLQAALKKGANQKLAQKVVKSFTTNKNISFTNSEKSQINKISWQIH